MRVNLQLSFTFNRGDEPKHLASSTYQVDMGALPPVKSTIRIHGFEHHDGFYDLDGIIEGYHTLIEAKVNNRIPAEANFSAEVNVTFAKKR